MNVRKSLFVTVPSSEWDSIHHRNFHLAMKDDRTLDVRQALAHLRENPRAKVKIPVAHASLAEKRRHLVLIYAKRCSMKVQTLKTDAWIYIALRPTQISSPPPIPRKFFLVTTAQEFRECQLENQRASGWKSSVGDAQQVLKEAAIQKRR